MRGFDMLAVAGAVLGNGSAGAAAEEASPDDQEVFVFTLISAALVITAGLMSGLTIGLMAIDQMELEVLKRSGTPVEKKYANTIQPLLQNHHFLLVTLVLWNAVAMEALPLFLDALVDPVTAVILSVTVVLIFGEIVPQAICTRYGLAVGYYSSPLVRTLMVLAAPIAWPTGKLLDYVLGHDGSALPREQLQAYIELHREGSQFAPLGEGLSDNELRVINSALELTYKRAKTAMTKIGDVFMLDANEMLSKAVLERILSYGHSRVPVFEGSRTNIVGQILIKEILTYTNEKMRVGELPRRSLPRLSAGLPMYDVLHLLKIGRSHMALLCEVPKKDPEPAATPFTDDKDLEIQGSTAELATESVGETVTNATKGVPVGIITMEDVLEELIGVEIIDETDRYVDNLTKAAVATSSFVDQLPRNVQALLQRGIFTPRMFPARPALTPQTTMPGRSTPPSPPPRSTKSEGSASRRPATDVGIAEPLMPPQYPPPGTAVSLDGAPSARSAAEIDQALQFVQSHLADQTFSEAVGVLSDAQQNYVPGEPAPAMRSQSGLNLTRAGTRKQRSGGYRTAKSRQGSTTPQRSQEMD